jgi:hypothetical protein
MARSDAKATRAELARAGKWEAAWAAMAARGSKLPPARLGWGCDSRPSASARS